MYFGTSSTLASAQRWVPVQTPWSPRPDKYRPFLPDTRPGHDVCTRHRNIRRPQTPPTHLTGLTPTVILTWPDPGSSFSVGQGHGRHLSRQTTPRPLSGAPNADTVRRECPQLAHVVTTRQGVPSRLACLAFRPPATTSIRIRQHPPSFPT